MYSSFDHDAFARSKDEQDFWGQIRRTVNGQSVTEDQILIIKNAIEAAMPRFNRNGLLDIGCGNGALTYTLKDKFKYIHAIDPSEYLISIGRKYFAESSNINFFCGGTVDFLFELEDRSKKSINMILFYGSMSYISTSELSKILEFASLNLPNNEVIYFGNVPDIEKFSLFFSNFMPPDLDLQDHHSAIGKWWSKEELSYFCGKYGFKVDIIRMNQDFYGHQIRFDAKLTRI